MAVLRAQSGGHVRAVLPAVVAALSLGLLAAARPAAAQSVQAQISSDEAFVGELVSVDLTISDMTDAVKVVPPQTPDFEIIPAPNNPVGRSSRVSIVNGRRTDSVDLTYHYEVRPVRVGRLVLPPFQVNYGGQVYRTQQFTVTVTSESSSSLVFCQIRAPAETVYVGQAIKLTLEIWIQKFKQADIGMLDVQTMWSAGLRNPAATSLGVFSGVDFERPQYAEHKSKDENGVMQDYYVFTLQTMAIPSTPGPFDFGEVAFGYNYPVRLVRGGFFNLRMQRTRRLRILATKPPLTVKALPQEGRPPDFNGAVGVYSIRTWAKPTEVPVGDPITLNLEIQSQAPLERLSAPKLDQLEALKRDFEISGESLAGTVEGNRKVFSQTIRALREDVKEIPPVPMSYFNVQTGRYETAWSEAIPLTVKPADRLVLTNAGGSAERGSVLVPLSETTEGLFGNEDRVELVLADQSGTITPGAWVLLIAAPLGYAVTWLVQRRAVRFRSDEVLRRRTQAYATARKSLRNASGTTPPAPVRSALLGYIADCCGVPAAGLTRVEAVRLITARGIPAETVQEVDTVLEALEIAEYGGGAGALQDAPAAAWRLVDTLERQRLR